jgi:transcriptional regulator with XRE-family HTH domain
MPLLEFLESHGLTERDVVDGTGLPRTTVNDVVRGRRSPRSTTIDLLLAFARKYDKAATYDGLFAGPALVGRARR